jgi:hypothetical protein
MIENATTEVAALPGKTSTTNTQKTRVSQILRWAARITSIPVAALVLSSLLPALASFSVSAKDDKLIAVGLGVVLIGFIASWRWPSFGGALAAGGVVLILAQGDSWLSPDPFSIAFGLQGLLFLISGLLNVRREMPPSLIMRNARALIITLLVLCAAAGTTIIYRGPGPTPVPKDKESFVGLWQNGAGFTMEITPEGQAKIAEDKDSKVDEWNNPLTGRTAEVMQMYFRADEKLELTEGPFGKTKVYHIDRSPHPDGKQIKMILNGSDPYNRGSGMLLVKRPAR